METRRGIYTDLKESKYSYLRGGLIFFFSSLQYQKKFEEMVDNYVIEHEIKLFKKYGVQNAFTFYFMIALYRQIEKRGFRIIDSISKKEIKENFVVVDTFM